METNEPKEPIHWLKACGPVRYLACGESLRPTQSPTYQRDKVATLAEIAEKPSGTMDEIRTKIEIQTQLARIRIRLNNDIS